MAFVECPFCSGIFEWDPFARKICRHCGADVDAAAAQAEPVARRDGTSIAEKALVPATGHPPPE